ncbi:O-fucosyltransferase family protein [Forsythia ovata]|uniref:O-fucosyltransferase family protein n=1 Tax=Forsythia ovata TaxID=205694 RepID=A0ABD1S4N0_9LAMI
MSERTETHSNFSEIMKVDNTSNEDDEEHPRGSRIPARMDQNLRRSTSPARHSSSSPRNSSGTGRPTRFSLGSGKHVSSASSLNGWLSGLLFDPRRTSKGKRKAWYRRKMTIGLALLIGVFFLMNWLMLSSIQDSGRSRSGIKFRFLKANSSTVSIREELQKLGRGKKPQKTIYARLLAKAAHALAERQNKPEPKDLWMEPYVRASSWTPCAHMRDWEPSEGSNGYIMVTANGGINQQRVAVCNAVAVARLLNATLVLPKFMYSSVWTDTSQFGDIYQEEHFINYLKPDIRIVKELPKELQSLDLEAIGSVVTDVDVVKEAKPSFYLKYILPILHLNRVIHLVGFGNRLASDPVPSQLQRLRCRCNFHALKFVPKIQEAGALLIQRMRQNDTGLGHLDHYLVGPICKIRGEEEKRELESYRAIHFPALMELKKMKKLPSPAALRPEGLCPLMPEETVLMLAALGFNRQTHIFLAGAHIYGGKSRLAALTTLFPNLVTKENLLSPTEIQPFVNFSSQLAALDFIVCTAADVFAMTDSGSQFSSLVAGYRIYYGGGKMPTIRPNKRRLADIFVKNNTIEWKVFEQRVRKAVRQNKRVFSRPVGRSVYRYPRCSDCMCNMEEFLLGESNLHL